MASIRQESTDASLSLGVLSSSLLSLLRLQVVAMVAGGVLVGAMTAGLGLVAPMVIVGVTAAAGGGATAYGVRPHNHK